MLIIIISYLMIFLAVLCLLLGFNILLKNGRNALHIIFFIQTAIISLYIISIIFIHLSDSIKQLMLFQKIAMILLLSFFPFFFHFAVTMTKARMSKIVIILSYLISVIISIIIMSADNTLANARKIYGFWIFKDSSNTLWFAAFNLFIGILYLAASYLLFRWIKKTTSKKEE